MAEQVVVELRADASNLVKGFQQAEDAARGFGNTVKKGTSTAKSAIDSTNTNLKKTGATVEKSKVQFSSLGKSIANSFLPIIGAVAIIGKLRAAFSKAIDIVSDFDKATAELSSITGAVGKDLDFLTDKALELGPRFGKGASEVVNAFKLVGSARPELLKNGAALAEVTEQALLLSQASGDELESSVDSLTTILGQFNEPAKRAGEIVNALAAGSKFGAAPVDKLSETLKRSGIVLSQSNVQTEEAIALAELLAEKQLIGAEAGTGLSAVFNKLNAVEVLPKDTIARLTAANVNLEVLGDTSAPVADRLNELGKIAGDSTTLFKLFGEGGQKAGAILAESGDKFVEFTKNVTGTTTAIDQAAIATETLAFQGEKTEAIYESLILSLDNGNGSLSNATVAWEKVQQAIFGAAKAYNDGTSASNENISAVNEAIQSLSDLGIGFADVAGEAQELTDEVRAMNIAFDALIKRNVDARIASDGLLIAVKKQEDVVRDLAKQYALAADEDKERIQVALTQQNTILNALTTEVEARKEATSTSVATRKVFGKQIEDAETEETALTEKELEARRKAREKAAADAAQLAKDLEELRIRVLKDGLEQELALLDLAFEEESEKFKGNAEGIKLLEQQLAKDKEAITQEFRQKEAEERQNTLKDIEANRREAFDLEIEAAQRAADEKKLLATEEETSAKELADAEVAIEIEKLNTLIELRKAAGEDTLALEQQLASIRRDIRQEEIEAEKELEAERAAAREEVQRGAQELFFTLLEEQTQRKLEASEAETNRELAIIDAQLKSETISQAKREALEQQRQAIEEQGVEQAKQIERDAAQRDLAIANFEALINGAVAITKALSIDPTGVLAASVAAQTAIQLALINAEQIPAFAEGTSKVTGGTPGKDSVLAHLMPGERVVKVETNKKHWDPLEAMRNGNYEQFVWNNDVAPALREAHAEYERREAFNRAKEVAEHTYNLNNSGSAKFNDRNIVLANKEGNKVLYGIYDQLEEMNRADSGPARRM